MKVVSLYGSRAKNNFPIGCHKVPEFIAIDPRGISHREVLENQEAFERLEVARANEMAELHQNHPELIAQEC